MSLSKVGIRLKQDFLLARDRIDPIRPYLGRPKVPVEI